jgi:hypothetical protein
LATERFAATVWKRFGFRLNSVRAWASSQSLGKGAGGDDEVGAVDGHDELRDPFVALFVTEGVGADLEAARS